MNYKKALIILVPMLFFVGTHTALAYIHEYLYDITQNQCAGFVGVQSYCGDGIHKTVIITGYKYEYGVCTLYSECNNGLGTIVVGGDGGTGIGVNPYNENNPYTNVNPPVITVNPVPPSVILP